MILECCREDIFRVWGSSMSTQAPEAPGPPLKSGMDTEMSQGDRNGERRRGPHDWQPR